MEFKKREVKRKARPPLPSQQRRKEKVFNTSSKSGPFMMRVHVKCEMFEIGNYDKINLRCPVRSEIEEYNSERRRREYSYRILNASEAQIVQNHWHHQIMSLLGTTNRADVAKKLAFQYEKIKSKEDQLIEESANTCTTCGQNRKG